MSIWDTAGPDRDVTLSSRIRLARNYGDVPFPSAMSEREAAEVTDRTIRIFKNAPLDFTYSEMRAIPQQERFELMERHLISPEMAGNTKFGAILISRDELACIMINEEDHLRIQCMSAGLDLPAAMALANGLDGLLEQSGAIARDERYGYLTACLTNVGAGLRASVMMHLPAMTMTRQIQGMAESAERRGLTVRGLYGEKSQAAGNIYQISNQATASREGAQIAGAVGAAARQIIAKEREARSELMEKNRLRMQDKLFRSLGTLKYARRLNIREYMALLSDLRLAHSEDLVEGVTMEQINAMMITGQPAGLMRLAGHELDPQERDIIRGNYARSALAGCMERK